MLRDFQVDVQNQTLEAYHDGAVVVMDTMATGGGKTVLFCDTLIKFNCPSIVVAHRQELVSQASLALNRERVPHSIIAPKQVIREIIAAEHEEYGYSTYNSQSPIRVAGVDTLRNRDTKDRWFSQVRFGVIDEAHHALRENKWGRAIGMFPNAHWMFPTAHCVRADGKGLGREGDGFVDRLIVGPHARQLMDRGFLTDYRVICAQSDVDFDSVPIGASGELNMPILRAVTHASNHLVGDVVKAYLEYAPGKLGLTFAVDKEEAVKLRNAFMIAGVPAEVITDETPIRVRGQLMRKFRARQILQLVSVDCLGEGTDVPAVEVISLARRTASWQLLCQQIGRLFRVLVDECYAKHWGSYSDLERLAIIANSTKPKGIIIDHVGNIVWHATSRGLPDSPQEYTLLKQDRGCRKSDAIPLRVCMGCKQPYEAYRIKCPYCQAVPVPAGRSTPEMVDGDMIELDAKVLQALRGESDRIMGPVRLPANIDNVVRRSIIQKHHDRYTGQLSLRHAMMIWGGWQKHRGLQDREAWKLFYLKYSIDVESAKALGVTDAAALETRINADLERANVYEVAA